MVNFLFIKNKINKQLLPMRLPKASQPVPKHSSKRQLPAFIFNYLCFITTRLTATIIYHRLIANCRSELRYRCIFFARVGHNQSPQIPHQALREWKQWVDFFLDVWGKIIAFQKQSSRKQMTITTEFGPPPYMWTQLSDGSLVGDQWEINVYMKDLL